VSFAFTYDLNGNEIAPLSGVQSTISLIGGEFTTSSTSGSYSNMLTYGNYTLNVQPSYVTIPGTGKVISDGYQEQFTVSSSSLTSLSIFVPVAQTYLTNVSLTGLVSGESAALSFSTMTGYTFYNVTENADFTAYLPHGKFYVNVDYLGTQFSLLENNIINSINVSLSSSQVAFGNVETSTNTTINSFTAVLFNKRQMNIQHKTSLRVLTGS
jgi:hypothetical protein